MLYIGNNSFSVTNTRFNKTQEYGKIISVRLLKVGLKMIKTINILSYKITVFGLSEQEKSDYNSIVYAPLSLGEAQEVYDKLCEPKPILAAIEGIDWERDLTPFKAKKAFHGGRDFSGGSKEYLRTLCDVIIPQTEKECGISPRHRGIAGYSLAGLFAVYSLFNCECFDTAASVSGSLWFDGFLESIADKKPLKTPQKVYFSVGDTEKLTKSERMATVEDATVKTAGLFDSFGSDVKFELNRGGHFKDVPERISKGINFISQL